MTKQEQLIINDYCEEEILNVVFELEHFLTANRLRTCNAYVYETHSYYVLRSYASYVAFIRKSDRECFDVLRRVYGYTATSAQHIAKFKNDYNAVSCQIWREV